MGDIQFQSAPPPIRKARFVRTFVGAQSFNGISSTNFRLIKRGSRLSKLGHPQPSNSSNCTAMRLGFNTPLPLPSATVTSMSRLAVVME